MISDCHSFEAYLITTLHVFSNTTTKTSFPNSYSFQTVVLKGLNKEITKKHIYKKTRKSGDVKEIIYPVSVKSEAEGETQSEEQIEEGTGMRYPAYNSGSQTLRKTID